MNNKNEMKRKRKQKKETNRKEKKNMEKRITKQRIIINAKGCPYKVPKIAKSD